ncbi:DUF6443 domain-containing protein [Aquimarina sp. 2304DJ70-9]|uniref:DUF6443 domain-containing protein n=1 Tax=Aquimarina penaris TaxID=3231044 RepID=UPI003462EB6A
MKKLMIVMFFLSFTASFSQGLLVPLPPPPSTCYYPDLDGDGYGDASANCIEIPDGITQLVTNNLDCDDTNPNVNLGGQAYYYDLDGDGLGNPNNSIFLCVFDPTLSIVEDSSDCDDTNASIGEPDTWHLDADGDFYKARPNLTQTPTFPPFPGGPTGPAVLIKSCSSPGSNYINANDPRLQPVFDCDDNDPSVNISPTWYADTDGDGLGDPNTSRSSCTQPNGYVSNNQDSCPDFASPENNCPYTPVQLSNENYIYTKVYLKELTDDSMVSDDKDVKEHVIYYDGLGRPIQDISIKDNPMGNDVVHHYEYDQFGRTEKTYLPLPTTQNTGSLVTNPVLQINAYYQDKYGDNNPFAQQRFENSLISRVLESAAPGNDWQLSATSDSDHTTKYEYETNNAFDVKKYDINEDGAFVNSYYSANELTKNTVKNENWNPTTDGGLNTIKVFTDKNGRKVSEITYNNSGSSGFEKLTTNYVYDDLGRLTYIITPKAVPIDPVPFSYTEFDQFITNGSFLTIKGTRGPNSRGGAQFSLVGNRLTVAFDLVLDPGQKMRNGRYGTRTNLPDMYIGNTGNGSSPNYDVSIKNGYLYIEGSDGVYELIKTLTVDLEANYVKFDPDVLDQLCYQYKYDQYNRKIEQKSPGKGWEYIIYDQLDRQILVQDANIRKDNLWLFTKYDAFGRVTYSGKYSSTKSRNDLQAEVDTFINTSSNKSNIENRSIETTLILGTAISYSNTAFPITGFAELLSINYYDDYSFTDSDKPVTPSIIDGQAVTNKTKSLLTANWSKTIGENSWSKTYSYYDEKGRRVRLYEKNHLGGYTSTDSKLDFRGKLERSLTKHKRVTNSDLITIVDTHEYDKSERVKSQYQKINDQAVEHLFTNNYTELGLIDTKNVGGKVSGNSNNSLQNIAYKYNIRSWLKEINDVDNIGNNLFAYKLNYNEPIEGGDVVDAKSLFNGNISQTIWRSKYDNLKQSYAYNFNALDQLTDASYLSGDILGRVSTYKYEVHNIKYDKNGNITYLNRKGLSGAGNPADPDFKQLDYLTYTYGERSNQLMAITDTGDKTAGFIDGNTSGDDYEYDDNGNLIKDLNKGISLIEYNHMNLVEKVTFLNNKSIRFIYDASGRKLSKVYVEGNSTTETEYIGSFQYQQGQLQFFPSSEGYVFKDNNDFKYTYIYSDHLGNNRVTYNDANADGIITSDEILSNSNYYPMGSILEGEFNASIASNYNYKFQGKELQLDNNIGLYDFGSRMYDSNIGRWFTPDPQNQFSSPYLAMGNNPILLVDPNGEEAITIGAIIVAAVAVIGGLYSSISTAKNGGDFFQSVGAFTQGAGTAGFAAGAAFVTGGLISTTGIAYAGTLAAVSSSVASTASTNLIQGNGVFEGVASDAIGSLAGAYIGGGIGAFSGGAISGGIQEGIDGGNFGEILTSAGTSGALSLASYHVMQEIYYQDYLNGPREYGNVSRSGYQKFMATGQRSFSRNREGGGYFVANKKGGLDVGYITFGEVNKVQFPLAPDNVVADFHFHVNKKYLAFPTHPDDFELTPFSARNSHIINWKGEHYFADSDDKALFLKMSMGQFEYNMRPESQSPFAREAPVLEGFKTNIRRTFENHLFKPF